MPKAPKVSTFPPTTLGTLGTLGGVEAQSAPIEGRPSICTEFSNNGATWDAEDWHAFYEERAGITQFDAGLPDADRRAFECCIVEWMQQNPRAAALECLSRAAYELIQVIALERSGIRDGDGYWHGSDALDGTVNNLVAVWERLTVTDHECREYEPTSLDSKLPF